MELMTRPFHKQFAQISSIKHTDDKRINSPDLNKGCYLLDKNLEIQA